MNPEGLLAIIDSFAPFDGQLEGDSSGVVVSGTRPIERVVVCLELEDALEGAVGADADAIICHHPPHYGRPGYPLRGDALERLAAEGRTVIACHTNADAAPNSFVDRFGEEIGLAGLRVLEPIPIRSRTKVVTFVPESHASQLIEAAAQAGAGSIGGYTACSFRAPGTGTFFAGADTQPFIGKRGVLNEEAEVRLELEAAARDLPLVLETILSVHPYEEPVVEVYPVERYPRGHGLGRIGSFSEEVSIEEVFARVASVCPTARTSVDNTNKRRIRRAAHCPGSGRSLLSLARARGAEVYITADLGYHDREAAARAGLVVIEADHDDMEKGFVPWMTETLRKRIVEDIVIEGIERGRREA